HARNALHFPRTHLSKMAATPLRRSVTFQLAQFAGLWSLNTDAYNSAAYNPVECRCSVAEASYTTVQVHMPKDDDKKPRQSKSSKEPWLPRFVVTRSARCLRETSVREGVRKC